MKWLSRKLELKLKELNALSNANQAINNSDLEEVIHNYLQQMNNTEIEAIMKFLEDLNNSKTNELKELANSDTWDFLEDELVNREEVK